MTRLRTTNISSAPSDCMRHWGDWEIDLGQLTSGEPHQKMQKNKIMYRIAQKVKIG
jgi:hypothetical protein